ERIVSAPLNGMIKREAMETFQSFLTGRFDSAFQLASGLHHSQRRKGTEIPYISHLMSVAALVLEAGGDEDQAIAALLHDAMEDQADLLRSRHADGSSETG
ncbi:MAG: HD domain-containing protein, partial [Candidatus Acidiferrales bacterium]